MSDIAAILVDRGLRPSVQRMAILSYLRSTKAHPSVETVWRALLPSMPTLSRTTVYATLDLLAEARLAQPIHVDGEELRWDGDASEHGHFHCGSCGRVYDFTTDPKRDRPRLPRGFAVDRVQLYCSGTCAACAASRGDARAPASGDRG